MAAIKGFMAETWDVNIKQINTKIKNFITNAVEDGELIRKSGKYQFFLMIIMLIIS